MKTQLTTVFFGFFIIILLAVFIHNPKTGNIQPASEEGLISKTGVCPPFHLLDEEGNIINPVEGVNTEKPYSPK